MVLVVEILRVAHDIDSPWEHEEVTGHSCRYHPSRLCAERAEWNTYVNCGRCDRWWRIDTDDREIGYVTRDTARWERVEVRDGVLCST